MATDKVFVERWALDDSGNPWMEVSAFVLVGTNGVAEDDSRAIHLPGRESKWLFLQMAGSFFGDEITPEQKQDPKHPFWSGPFRQGPLNNGLRLVDEATYQKAVEEQLANKQE